MFERSYHFIPADKPRLFDRVFSLGADAYVFDLEDAVARREKKPALSALDAWLGRQDRLAGFFVRVNGCHDSLAGAELELLGKYPQVGVVLPKVSSAAGLADAAAYYRLTAARPVIGLIEDATGLAALPSILALKLLCAVGLGMEDFLCHSIFTSADLTALISRIRTEIALAAMAHGIAGIDTISLDLAGGKELQEDVQAARSCGFTGKFSIHPSQIAVINEAFCPMEATVKKASALSSSSETSAQESGYLLVAGEIMSPPKIKKLNLIKQFSDHHGLTKK